MNLNAMRKPPFKQVLNALIDTNNPFPPIYLHRFSNLEPQEVEELKAIWSQIDTQRKRSLLGDLEDLAEADDLLSFDELARFTLNDNDPVVRTLAIRLLWEAEDKKLVPAFLEMMERDPDVEVRSTAASALGRYVYLGEVDEIPEELLHTIEERLLAVTRGSDHPKVRQRALEALGYSGRPEVPELLLAAYASNDSGWLTSALFAMGRSADTRWENEVIRMLDHTHSDVRLEAVRAAGELGLSSAREPLIEMLTEDGDEDDFVRSAAIWSLSQIGGENVRDVLENLLENTEDEDEADLLEDALDNLSFTEDMQIFEMFDFNPDGDKRIFDQEEDLEDSDNQED